MACGCRFYRTRSIMDTTYSAPVQPISLTTPDSSFVPMPLENVPIAEHPLFATIDLPGSLAPSAQTAVAAGNRPANDLSARNILRSTQQEFLPSRVFQVKQTVRLSGVISGLPVVAGMVVSYFINGMPGSAITDDAGRYTLEAYPWETVAVFAPVVEGYRVTPESYVFTPVRFSNLDLDFQYSQ